MSLACCWPSNAFAMTLDIRSLPIGVELLAEGRFEDALTPLRLAVSLGDTSPVTLLNLRSRKIEWATENGHGA
jgi:hypothetical protein